MNKVPIKKGNVSTIETHYTYDPLNFDYLPSITIETDREMPIDYRKKIEIKDFKANQEGFYTYVNEKSVFNKLLPISFTYGKETINKEQNRKNVWWFTKLFC
jgi:hypothetical protein